MKRKSIILLFSLLAALCLTVILTVSPAKTGALNPNHGCDTCHKLHGSPGQALNSHAVVEDLCLSCHGPLGVSTLKAENHFNKAGSSHGNFKMTCQDCHNPHSDRQNHLGGTNLVMVGKKLDASGTAKIQTPNGGIRDVAFVSRGSDKGGPQRHSFADNDNDNNGLYDGICEVCHTQTQFHRNGSGGNHGHFTGRTCTICHKHEDGFLATGGCTLCHVQTQDNGDGIPAGGRRAVNTEFGFTSHHASFSDDDCKVCHDVSRHQGGYLRFKNVDDQSVVALSGEPSGSASEASKMNAFCLACHDADGAAGKAPFSDGKTPPVIDAAKWNSATHKLQNYNCYGNGQTIGCHDSGHGSRKKNMLSPYNVAATPPLLPQEEEGFCYNCHDGSPGSNIQPAFAKSSNHGVHSFGGIHVPWDNIASAAKHVECGDCHNPHQANSASASPPAVFGEMLGVPGEDIAGAAVVPAQQEYQVCMKCHADSRYYIAPTVTQEIDTSNLRTAFNPTNASFHPVAAVGKSSRVPSLLSPYTTNSRIYCTDCHDSDAGAAGPHGSIYNNILDRRYDIGGNLSYSSSRYALCFKCHRSSTVNSESRAGFEEHRKHIDGENSPCSVCHDPHGVPGRPALINFDLRYVFPDSSGRLDFFISGNRGYCYLRCHGENHNPESYQRE